MVVTTLGFAPCLWVRWFEFTILVRMYRSITLIQVLPSVGTPGALTLVTTVNEANPWQHDWHRDDVENLTIRWNSGNISSFPNSRVDINLWGYYEDVIDRDLVKVMSENLLKDENFPYMRFLGWINCQGYSKHGRLFIQPSIAPKVIDDT